MIDIASIRKRHADDLSVLAGPKAAEVRAYDDGSWEGPSSLLTNGWKAGFLCRLTQMLGGSWKSAERFASHSLMPQRNGETLPANRPSADPSGPWNTH